MASVDLSKSSVQQNGNQSTKTPLGIGEYEKSPVCGVEKVDTVDQELDGNTPDQWIARHPKLIRCTGKFPLNAEPPTTVLMKQGLITPNSLHYVRNHGAVPKLDWSTHTVEVSGLVENPKVFSMDELIRIGETISVAVTLACDGNRRKELNMIKHTKGFNWGCGAVSTAVWKGVRLGDVLAHCKVKSGAKYVCFEGADRLARGSYGTSIPLPVATVAANDVMLAYMMNDELLPPDHGFPVRVIIPGYVGGRMVKWLSKVIVTDQESTNYYHLHDNKVFPPAVQIETVDTGNWWNKPEYALSSLNINSVITKPAHNDYISMDDPSVSNLSLEGYAYSGGGRRVNRVEVTIDNGATWELAKLEFPEHNWRHAQHCWVWCHWKLEIPLWMIVRANNIAVRAWDTSCNTQPENYTWNLLGMLNNAHYKVKLDVGNNSAAPFIIFKHPVQPANLPGGWMVKKEESHPPLSSQWFFPPSIMEKALTMEEVREHNKPDDCWIVIEGRVFDVTSYLNDHPGAASSILVTAGGDASLAFREIHSPEAYDIKEWYAIGKVVETPVSLQGMPPSYQRALNPRKWIDVTLIEKRVISPDTRIFIFETPGKQKLGLPVGQHILLGAQLDGHFVVRPYTPTRPVSMDEDNGLVEVIVKIYAPGKSKAFPAGGVFSQYLESLKIGATVRMKGPAGHILYHGRGRFTIDAKAMSVKKVSMVAGGTGITPMFQLMRAIAQDETDTTKVALLYANHSVDDILLKDELEDLCKRSNKISVWFTVSSRPQGEWKYSVGRISEHLMKQYLLEPGVESVAFVCGPPAMVEHACIPGLESIGYTETNLIEF